MCVAAVVAVGLAAGSAGASPPGGREVVRRSRIVDVEGAAGPMAGTDRGTVVLIDAVPSMVSPTAVRRREVGATGVLSDTTTPLPEGFAWTFSSLDGAGGVALASTTEARLLGADGTLSEAFVASHEIAAIDLAGGFLHLAETRSASPRRTTAVWEGRNAAGDRVGPSEALEPDLSVTHVDWQGGSELRYRALVLSLDGRADGSASLYVMTASLPDFTGYTWLYAVDRGGAVRPVPGPGPTSAGLGYGGRTHGVVAGASGATCHVYAESVGYLAVRGWVAQDDRAAYGPRAIGLPAGGATWWANSPFVAGAAADGRLIVLAAGGGANRVRDLLGVERPVLWASFTPSADGFPQVRQRLAGVSSRRERFRRRGCDAAVAPDGGSVVAAPEVPAVGQSRGVLRVWTLDGSGRVSGQSAVRARAGNQPVRAVACGDTAFAVRFSDESVVVPRRRSESVGDAPAPVRTRLLFLRRTRRS